MPKKRIDRFSPQAPDEMRFLTITPPPKKADDKEDDA